MTSNSRRLIDLAHSFAASGGAVDERAEAVILRGSFATDDERSQWLVLRGQDIAPFRSLQVYDPEVGGDLDAADPFSPQRSVVLTLVKPLAAHSAAFVFSSGVATYLQGKETAPKIYSAELEPRAAFQARGLEVVPWDPNKASVEPALPIAISPRPFVRDFVPDREVAEDLSPWILSSEPGVDSAEYRAWMAVAARRLLAGLVSSAIQEGGVVWLQAAGPPLIRFRADDASLSIACNALAASSTWVFLSGQDVEVRHMIFAAELARAYRADQPLPEVLSHALESAKTTYEAHVQSASRETLKALGELRKSVIDEAQKVTQRAQDLTSGLWRDLAIATAPFVLKVIGDANKAASPGVTSAFYFAAAIFIFISFTLQTKINRRYLDNQRAARECWFETLYSYVSADERQRIAETPIAAAETSYEDTKGLVGSVYLALVVILLGFGLATLMPSQTNGVPTKTQGVSSAPASEPTPFDTQARRPPSSATPRD